MITIVSGLPRSGTSLMMQMLAAGGMQVLSDGERRADSDNPKGYIEWERIKQLPQDPGLIAEAEGKVVKVISRLLLSLPEGHEYRVIFMQRPLPEVLASQEAMMRRRGTSGAGPGAAIMTAAFEKHLREVDAWLAGKAQVKTLRIAYHDLLQDAKGMAQKIVEFLGIELNVEEMTCQVDASLYRNRQ
jgi:LPS sulfotransferase NodH